VDHSPRKITRSIIQVFGLKVISTLLILLISLLLSRLLGVAGFGVYTYAITIAGLLSIPASLGLNRLLVREIAIYKTQSDWGLLRGIIAWANKIVLLLGIGIALAAAAIVGIFGLGGSSNMTAFMIAFLSLPMMSLRGIRLAALQGLNKVVKGQIPELIITPVLMIVGVGIAQAFLKTEFTTAWALAIYVAVTTVTCLVGTHWLNAILPIQVRNSASEYRIGFWLRSALPMMLLSGLQLINSQIDVLMIGAMKGTTAVGIYVVLLKSTQLIVYILGATNTVLAPIFAHLYAAGNFQQLRITLNNSTKLVLSISTLFTILLILGRKQYLSLFGAEFLQGELALVLLSIGQLVNAGTGSVGVLLNMTRNENYTAISVALGLIFSILADLILIPKYGINGAAISSASSMIIFNLVKVAWVHKKLGFNPILLKEFK
jgi:O-antigen/teichoic acid export membrane protein